MPWLTELLEALRRLTLYGVLFAVLGAPSPSVAAEATAGVGRGATVKSKAAAEYESPRDQPRFRGAVPETPKPPPSFNTYDGGWIQFAYPPAMRERVQPLINDADGVRRELSDRLGQPVLDDVLVYVARTPGEMSTLAPEGAPYPKYASGVAYSQIGLVLLTINPLYANSDHDVSEVFRHELAHVALHDAVGGRQLVPRWFNEGFAIHASGESSLSRLQTLWTATLSNNLMAFSRLDRGFPADSVEASIAYAQSADVVRFLLRRRDRERFSSLIARIKGGQGFEAAMRDAYGLDMAGLEFEWREEVAKRYSFWPVFFSGSLLWVGVIGLFFVGWRRRKRRSQKTLERWRREEAREDARRVRAAGQAAQTPQGGRVHIVLSPSREPPELPDAVRPPVVPPPEGGEVPKVEHEGQWHTLH